MRDLIEAIDGLDLVVGLADGLVPEDQLAAARRAATEVRERHGFLGRTLVLGLIGGTGSGKSSVLNAIAGEEVASVSALRPHTQEPLAWIPDRPEPALVELLDRLGIEQRVGHSSFEGIAILDAMDMDSLEVGHRRRVAELLPQVDGVIWVLDPVKYRDPLLHEQFIAPLADSADQFLFVLNQIDRLAVDQVQEVIDDLRDALAGDGITDPQVFGTAARPPAGRAQGIDALAEHLDERLDAKRVYLGKVLADLKRASRDLSRAAGVTGGGSVAFEQRWAALLDAATRALSVAVPSRAAVEESVCGVEDFLAQMASETGGVFAARLRALIPRVEEEVRAALVVVADGVALPPGRNGKEPRLMDPRDRAAAMGILTDQLDRRLGAPVRSILWERASLAASVAGLGVGAAGVEMDLRQGAST